MMVADEVFAAAGSVDLRYDAILQDRGSAAAVVCIHGGGWVSGDRSDMHDVAQYFAAQGFAAFCPQYRLAPLYAYPAAIEDVATFVRYLREKADSLGILPDSIGVIGNSAGGHLAAISAFADNAKERPNAVVDICGLTDLTNYRESHPPISWDFLGQFMAGVDADDSRWIEASPLYRVVPESPPFLIIHGEDDDVVYVDQSRRLHQALSDAGVKSELEVLPREGHSFTEPAFRHILDRAKGFFHTYLKTALREPA